MSFHFLFCVHTFTRWMYTWISLLGSRSHHSHNDSCIIIIASFDGFCQTPAQCWGCELLANCLASAVVICQASRSAAAIQLSTPSVVERISFIRATQADHPVPCPLFYCRMTLLPRMDPPRCLGVDQDQGCVVPLHWCHNANMHKNHVRQILHWPPPSSALSEFNSHSS